jgi:hypothetical protein
MVALQEEERMRAANIDRMSSDIMLGAKQQMAATQAPVNQPSLLASALMFGANATKTMLDSGYDPFKGDPGDKKSRLPGLKTKWGKLGKQDLSGPVVQA